MHPEFNVIKTLEWCVELPSRECPQKSPVLLLKDSEFVFRFIFEEGFSRQLHYNLYVDVKNQHGEFKTCKGSFEMGFKYEETLSLVEKRKFAISKLGSTKIWNRLFEDIQSQLPNNYAKGNCIKMLFYFDDMKESLLDVSNEAGQMNESLESLSQDFGRLLSDELDHDVKLECDDHTWNVHKNVLSVRSKVLQAMLHSDMIEGRTGVITLRDMDVPTAGHFLNYLYCGKLPEMTVETAKRFYEIGDKYAVDCLKKSCAYYLVRNLTPEIACELLIFAHDLSDTNFKEKVINFIIIKENFMNGDVWRDFRNCHPEIAFEVYDRFHKSE